MRMPKNENIDILLLIAGWIGFNILTYLVLTALTSLGMSPCQ